VLFSSHQLDLVEDLCESVVIIDRGRVVAAGAVDDLTTRGRPRLVVRVAGDRDGAWARGLAGVTVSENDGGALRLVLAPAARAGAADPQSVLRAAMAAGPVTEFAVRRRRLSEVFREAVTQRAERRQDVPAAAPAVRTEVHQ
jgi:ABC-2 type transport system ATP-binding protein